MANQNLGIRAKVEPEVDKSSQSRMMRSLEKDIEEIEEMSFSSTGIESKTTPGGGRGGGGGGGGVGSGMAGGAMARGGSGGIGGLMKGVGGGAGMMAGAAVLGTVALGGVLAEKIHSKLSEASGRLQAVNSIWSQASKLFLKPFGDKLADALLPYAKEGLDMAVKFNEIASDEGLKVAISSIGSDVESALGFDDPSISIPAPEDVFKDFQEFAWTDWIETLEWATYLNPMAWSSYVYELGWRTFVNSLTWENYVNVVKWARWINPINWGTWLVKLTWDHWVDGVDWGRFVGNVRWSDFIPSVTGSMILDMLFGHINIDGAALIRAATSGGGGGGGGSTTPTRPPSRTDHRRTSDRELYKAAGGGGGGGSNPDTVEVTVDNKLEMDNRRVSEGVRSEKNKLDSRIR